MQDGPTDLGTVTYNFTTGTMVSSNYSTGDIAVPIPDSPAPAINIPITVADVMTLTDVNVSFRIDHTFDGDLTIALVHPDNTVIPLVTNRGSSGVNFGTGTLDCAGVPTVIDDQAATAISAGECAVCGIIPTGVAVERVEREAVKRDVELEDPGHGGTGRGHGGLREAGAEQAQRVLRGVDQCGAAAGDHGGEHQSGKQRGGSGRDGDG